VWIKKRFSSSADADRGQRELDELDGGPPGLSSRPATAPGE
jgi:hypothetical protein